MTYKIPRSKQRGGQPTYQLSVPPEIGARIQEHARFDCVPVEDGLLYRLVKHAEPDELPTWLSPSPESEPDSDLEETS